MDYQAIIENLTEDRVKSILNHLEIPFEDRGAYLLMPTYCHNHKSEDASHKLYYYKNNKIFMCYTECSCGMSVFKFLRKYYEAQGYDYDWYRDIYQVIVGDVAPEGMVVEKYHSLKETYEIASKQVVLPTYSANVLDCFTKYYPVEWLNDSITPEVMDKYNILFSISQNKIIIPHYSVDNQLVGIRGRALNKEEIDNYGKYAPVWIEGKCYSHPLSMNLYGLNWNKQNILKTGVCMLYESEKSVMQAEAFSEPNCGVAVCGSQFNKYALHLLLREAHPSEIIICFDNEEEKNSDKYFMKLYSLCKKYQNYANFSFVYDRKSLTNHKDSPTDKGEAIFKQLIAERVRL